LHGVETKVTAQEAAATLAVEAGYVIQGTSEGGLASTVVDVTGDSPVVLRQGAVTVNDH
jgi:tRNA A37 threonylcarbamoyladenosine synthetase subunit TsaC/SUA5/YrdC